MVDSKEIYKHDYQLINEKNISIRDARVFASRLNACGRLNRPDIGIALCMGDRQQALNELGPITKEYSKKIGEGIQYFLSEGKIQDKTEIYFLDGRNFVDERIDSPLLSTQMRNKQDNKSIGRIFKKQPACHEERPPTYAFPFG